MHACTNQSSSQPLSLGIPLLSSKPGATRILYLDFNGHVSPSTNVGWGTFSARAYDIDNNPNSFNPTEQAFIQNVWQRVTEDFAPFQYDVTTVRPACWCCSCVPSD